jgi:hypothetical protein
MRDLSMEALKRAAAAAQQNSARAEFPAEPKKEAAKDPAPVEREERPLSADLPPGSSARLTDLKAARDNEDPDLDDIEWYELIEAYTTEERYEAAYDLIEALRGSGVAFRLCGGEVRYWLVDRISDKGRSELERVKSEVYKILREEKEREAWLANQPEVDPLPDDEYDDWTELTNEQQAEISCWIPQTMEIDSDLKASSYHLKHVFERSPDGFYVTDGQFRAAMWLCGFLGRRVPGLRNKDVVTRYYYVRPNREGLVCKLVRAGVPQEWVREAIMGTDEINGTDEIKGKEL